MFHSQGLASRKGPLGAIWVAAYFCKKLKKVQVTETDISSSVDKILQKEWDAVTYRVLAYLLLGVVRIYSKKVDYLFDDCHEVLIKINNFVVDDKNKVPMETLRAPSFSITLPDSFELDAFDMEINEDFNGAVPREDITLKDEAWRNEGMGQYSPDKYRCEEFAACQGSCSAGYNSTEDVFSHVMNIAKEVRAFCEQGNLEASMKNIRGNKILQGEHVNLERFCGVEDETPDTAKSSSEGHQTDGEHTEGSEMPHSENQMQGEANMENLRDVSVSPDTVYEVEEEHLASAELFGWDHQNGDHNQSNLPGSMEKLQGNRVIQGECMDFEMFHGAEEEPSEVVRRVGEEHYTGPEQMKFPNLISSVNRKCQFNTEGDLVSITPDVAPEPRFPNTSEATVPEFMVIPTPATKEGALMRRRKCLLDDTVVFPNSFMRQCIEDSSDLISKRKKVPHTALAAWRDNRMSSLFKCFLEPLIPCSSSDLRSLFSERRLKVPESAEIAEPPEELDLQESPVVARSLEQTEIAPETPVQLSKSVRSFENPVSLKHYNSDNAGPAESFESVEEERSSSEDKELDLSVLNEQDSSEGDDQQLYGWSGRTRMVASYLEKTFLNQRKRREEEMVNLSQVLKGKTKKESARFFYEILVLKTKGHIDVKQDNSYGDILVRKRDGAWGADVP